MYIKKEILRVFISFYYSYSSSFRTSTLHLPRHMIFTIFNVTEKAVGHYLGAAFEVSSFVYMFWILTNIQIPVHTIVERM